MKLKEGFITHRIQDTQMLVAVGEAAEEFHGLVRLNEEAAFIAECLKTETTAEEIVAKMQARYQVTCEDAMVDVRKIVDGLRSIGAIEG